MPAVCRASRSAFRTRRACWSWRGSHTTSSTGCQNAREMIFNVPALIDKLSSIVTLWPGDVIFTGTPDGVGVAQKTPRFLQPGDTLLSTIEEIGTLRTRFG